MSQYLSKISNSNPKPYHCKSVKSLVSPAIRVDALTVYLGSKKVISDVSFHIQKGQVLGVLGPNGAGKTSLLNALSGELAAHSGLIALDQYNMCELSAKQLSSLRVVLPQHSSMTFNLPVSAVVAMGAYPFMTAPQALVEKWVNRALIQVELETLQDRDYLSLSGGEQQRIQFARLLVQAFAIIKDRGHVYIFLDEPTASLDPKHQVLLMRVVRALADIEQATVMVVLHDLNMASRWCDKILLLYQGQVVAFDTPKHVLTSAKLEQVYGLPMKVMPHPYHENNVWVVADV